MEMKIRNNGKLFIFIAELCKDDEKLTEAWTNVCMQMHETEAETDEEEQMPKKWCIDECVTEEKEKQPKWTNQWLHGVFITC